MSFLLVPHLPRSRLSPGNELFLVPHLPRSIGWELRKIVAVRKTDRQALRKLIHRSVCQLCVFCDGIHQLMEYGVVAP